MARAVVSELAKVAPFVRLGDDCLVHSFAYIGRLTSQSASLARQVTPDEWCEIGAGCEIGVGAIIFGGVMIGRDCMIGDQSNIREGVSLGARCVVGVGTSILYDAQIAEEVKIMGGCHITGGCVIGKRTFVGVGVITTNDKHPEGYEFKGCAPPMIGERCLIGSGAVILPGVRIGDGAVIGAGALVTRDVAPGEKMLGEPARVLRAELGGRREQIF